MEPTKEQIRDIDAQVEAKVFAFAREMKKHVADKQARLRLIGALNETIDEAIRLAYKAGSENDKTA